MQANKIKINEKFHQDTLYKTRKYGIYGGNGLASG